MSQATASAAPARVSAAASQASPHLQRLSIAAADEFRQCVRKGLSARFHTFLEQLGSHVTLAANKALNPAEQKAFDELARLLSSGGERWAGALAEHVDAQLIGGGLPSKQVVAPGAGAEDSIALAQAELRAESRYRKAITELDARLNRLRLMLYVPISTRALAPASLSRSLQDTADAIGWPPSRRRLLFDRFGALFIPELESWYAELIEALTRIGKTAGSVARTIKAPPAAPPKRAKKKTIAAIEPPADTSQVDPETFAMLQSLALNSEGAGYTDGLLAADLLALADRQPLPGVAQDQSWVPLQRIALAGHFLNEVIADPMLPEELTPQHESMRYPLVKSALTDETLFTSPTHPLGSLLHELLTKSAASRVTGNSETRRLAELLQQVLVQFNLAPDFVRQAMPNAQAIEQTQIERFFQLQKQQAQQRRDFVIGEAKRMVVRELEKNTLGRNAPAPAIKFLNAAWGALLTKRLLQHGADHAIWKAGLALMDQLLDQLEAREPRESAAAEWHELIDTIGKALAAEGMAAEQVRLALMSLDLARKTPRA